MWNYEKRLQYPVRIKNPDPVAAQIIITQFGGPHCKKIIYHIEVFILECYIHNSDFKIRRIN